LTLDGDTLELGAIAATRMACPPPAGDVETAFVAALERAARWRVERDVLTLLDADDAELLEFEVAMPVGSWLATSILRRDALTSPIAGTELTALFAESGEVSGDTGLQHLPRGVRDRFGRDPDLAVDHDGEVMC
jgi:META domain